MFCLRFVHILLAFFARNALCTVPKLLTWIIATVPNADPVRGPGFRAGRDTVRAVPEDTVILFLRARNAHEVTIDIWGSVWTRFYTLGTIPVKAAVCASASATFIVIPNRLAGV